MLLFIKDRYAEGKGILKYPELVTLYVSACNLYLFCRFVVGLTRCWKESRRLQGRKRQRRRLSAGASTLTYKSVSLQSCVLVCCQSLLT